MGVHPRLTRPCEEKGRFRPNTRGRWEQASTHVLDVACAAGWLLSAVGAVADADEVDRVAAEADGDTESLKDDTKQPELLADAGIVGL